MKTINIHQARTHLSRLVNEAIAGEPFIIAKSGRPLVAQSLIEGLGLLTCDQALAAYGATVRLV